MFIYPVFNGHVVFNYKLNKGREKIIHEKISDIYISMKTEDYLELPPVLPRMEEIALDDKTHTAHKKIFGY